MRQLKITKSITNRSDSLQLYLNEIVKYPRIEAEDEVALAKKIQTGDMTALQDLVKANLLFVVSVAKQYQKQGLSLSDLINEGNIGLGKAAKRFDHTRGFKFISYAVWWIRQAILQALAENARIVRLPMNKVASTSKIIKMTTRFEQRYEREPSDEELAELLDVTKEEIKEMSRGVGWSVSLDTPIGEDANRTMIDSFKSDPVTGNADDVLNNESLKKEIGDILQNMGPTRDTDIVSHYFGVNGKEVLSLDEIGLKFEVSRERARQIKEKMLRRLRKIPRARKLNVYLGQ